MPKSTYSFFLGCAIPSMVLSYEISTRRIAKRFDIELVEMPEFSCCGLPIDPISHDMMLVLAAQNLCLAEQQGLNIMTMCPGCNGTLCEVNKMLKKDDKLRETVNGYLNKVGMEFKGNVSVKHLVQVLTEDVGYEEIKKSIQKPLKDLKVAAHYGCHILRPAEYVEIDDPENPTILKKLIEVTGATYLDYVDEGECCGATIIGSGRTQVDRKEDVSIQLARDKLIHLKEAKVQALITICPSCYRVFDVNQPIMQRLFGEDYGIPVLHYPELLALAMGINPNDLALTEHRVKLANLIEGL